MKIKDIFLYSIKDILGKRVRLTTFLIIILLLLIFLFSFILIGFNKGIKLYLLNKLKESNGVDRIKVNNVIEYKVNNKIEILSNIELFKPHQKFLKDLKNHLSKYIKDISFIASYPESLKIIHNNNVKIYNIRTFYPNDPFYKVMNEGFNKKESNNKIYRGKGYELKDEDRAVVWIVNDENITENLPLKVLLIPFDIKNKIPEKYIEIKGVIKENRRKRKEKPYAILPSQFLKRYINVDNISWWYAYVYVKNLKYIFKCKKYIENKFNFKISDEEKFKIYKNIIINKIDILLENTNIVKIHKEQIKEIINKNITLSSVKKEEILKDISEYFPKKNIPNDIKNKIENILSIDIKSFKTYFICDYPYKEILEKYLKLINLLDNLRNKLLIIVIIFFILLLSIASSWQLYQKYKEIGLLRCFGVSKFKSFLIYYLENIILIIISLILVYPIMLFILKFINPLIKKFFSIKYSIEPIAFYSFLFSNNSINNLLLERYYLYILIITFILSSIIVNIIIYYRILSNSLVSILKERV